MGRLPWVAGGRAGFGAAGGLGTVIASESERCETQKGYEAGVWKVGPIRACKLAPQRPEDDPA